MEAKPCHYPCDGMPGAFGGDGGYGVAPSAILDTFRNAEPTWQEDRETFRYNYDNTKLWLNREGEVVSTAVNHDSSKYRNK